jgi:hypothetical protein
VLFAVGVNGLAVSAREPIIVILTLMINQVIARSRSDTIPLGVPQFKVWFFTTFEAGVVAGTLLLFTAFVALWMFPKPGDSGQTIKAPEPGGLSKPDAEN